MHDLGGLIWIIIVVFAVISSMRKNVQRARAARAAQTQQPMRQATPPPAAVPPPPPAVRIDAAPPRPIPPPPVAPPRIVIAPGATIQTATPPLAPAAFPVASRVGTSPIRGMFGGSATLVRAIVAAEVLGQPISMQERTIWSPRHSEPSI